MDGGVISIGGIKIDKCTETNFHKWRHHELALWKRRGTKASAIIGLTHGSEQLKHVSGCKTTAEMCSTLQSVFQRKSLMIKMKARREFYTVKMTVGEGMLGYNNRVRNLGENLNSIGGEVTEMVVAMSVLNGLT